MLVGPQGEPPRASCDPTKVGSSVSTTFGFMMCRRTIHGHNHDGATEKCLTSDLREIILSSMGEEVAVQSGEKDKFADLRSMAVRFEERRQEARTRLEAERALRPSGSHLYLGMVGFTGREAEYEIAGVATIKRVISPPGEIELARAIAPQNLYGVVASYSWKITHELIIDLENDRKWGGTLNLAYWIACCIRISSLEDFAVPLCSDHSWSTIAAIADNSVNIRFLDHYPMAKNFSCNCSQPEEHILWTANNIMSFARLMSQEDRFNTAVGVFHSHIYSYNMRTAASALWAGIESLLGAESEITFRISSYIAAILRERGDRRLALYRDVKKLYGERSKAVHGGKIDDERMRQHIIRAREVLSALIKNITERGHMYTLHELEQLIFC